MVRSRSPLSGKYDTPVNRESAHEILTRRAQELAAATPEAVGGKQGAKVAEQERSVIGDLLWGTKRRQGMVETLAKQAARTAGSQLGRQILRGILGGILGGSRR